MAADILAKTIYVKAAGEGKAYTKVITIHIESSDTECAFRFAGSSIIWNGGTVPDISGNDVLVLTSANGIVWGTVISAS